MPRSFTRSRANIAEVIFPAATSRSPAAQSRAFASRIRGAPFSIACAAADNTSLRSAAESFATARDAARARSARDATEAALDSADAIDGWLMAFATTQYYRA